MYLFISITLWLFVKLIFLNIKKNSKCRVIALKFHKSPILKINFKNINN